MRAIFGFDNGGWSFVIWFCVALYIAVVTEFAIYLRAQNDVTQVFE